MHLRRALLLFAIVLGLTAVAAAVSPRSEDEAAVSTGPSPAPGSASALARELSFDASASKPAVVEARVDDHVAVVVSADEGGQVTIPRLGRTTTVTASDPARFDLLAPAAGRYDVLFAGSGEEEARRVGTLLTQP